MDARFLVYGHGHLSLPFQRCEHTGERGRVQHVGVLLSDPFQCSGEQRFFFLLATRLKDTIVALRMDS